MNPQLGDLIKLLLKEQEMSVVEFATAIQTTRENVYTIFKRESFDSDLLMRISLTLKHNMFTYYAKQVDQQLGIDSTKGSAIKPDFTTILNASTKSNIDILINENTSLKRENELLREINDLLKQKV
jgi:hypothetical protein